MYEVHGWKADGNKEVIECPDSEAEGWGLYWRDTDHLLIWISDHLTKEEAEAAKP